MHHLLGKIDALNADFRNSADLSPATINAAHRTLVALRESVAAEVDAPKPGSTMGLSGATITHRPDVAYAEGALREAEGRSHGGYLPTQRATSGQELAKAGIPVGSNVTIQQPAPAKPAEPAAIGMTTR